MLKATTVAASASKVGRASRCACVYLHRQFDRWQFNETCLCVVCIVILAYAWTKKMYLASVVGIFFFLLPPLTTSGQPTSGRKYIDICWVASSPIRSTFFSFFCTFLLVCARPASLVYELYNLINSIYRIISRILMFILHIYHIAYSLCRWSLEFSITVTHIDTNAWFAERHTKKKAAGDFHSLNRLRIFMLESFENKVGQEATLIVSILVVRCHVSCSKWEKHAWVMDITLLPQKTASVNMNIELFVNIFVTVSLLRY